MSAVAALPGRFTVNDATTPVKVTARLIVRARTGATEDSSYTSVMPLKSDPALACVMLKVLKRDRATHRRVREV